MKILRRIILFLAIILSVLWIEAAHADMSGPEIREFEIIVTNPNGVDYYDYKGDVIGHLEKDEKVYIMYIYNGEYTLGKEGINNYSSISSIGNVKSLDGFSIIVDEVDPTKVTEGITKLDTPRKAKINAEEGVDIYKGPAEVYDIVGHIPKGATLTYEYTSGKHNFTHIYVEYGGKKGWIEILNSSVLLEGDTQYVFSVDLETECGVIPKNTIMTPTYKTDPWKHKSIFEYNGCEFTYDAFKDDKVFDIYAYTEKTLVDLPIYEYADTTSTQLGTVPAGTQLTILASKEYMGDEEYVVYAKYNDITGWIISSGDIFDYTTYGDSNEKVEDTVKPAEKPANDIEPQTEKKPHISANELIIFCSMGGVLLIITAIAIVILVNKTKSNKEVKVDTPTETKKEEK